MQTPAFTAHGAISQQPLFYSASVPPIVMLTIGRDHKLYYEAYNDASDLDDDGVIDVGYKPGIDYYGYFDSHRCYDYNTASNGYFEPKDATLDKKCSTVVGAWSGDFLNYLTTARIDALRKVLYGGYRSEDTTSSTVLTRSFIPQDAHSWGKEYDPANNPNYLIADYTPLSEPELGTRHLFANVSLSYTGQPLLRVLNDSKYRVWEWVSIERPVAGTKCLHGGSGPDCAATGTATWTVVPSAVLSNLVRKTYKTKDSSFPSHPENKDEFKTFINNYDENLKGTDSLTTLEANGNPYRTDGYLTIVKGKITVPVSGSYKFSVDGDDAVEVLIGGSVIAGSYGGHGTCGCNDHNGTKYLEAGTVYDIEFHHEEADGGDSFVLRWEEQSTPNSNITDYSVNVKVCVDGKLEANCKAYSDGSTTTYKPIGLLHTYGEDDLMAFGLLTGSYKKNTSGGVLRKNISSFKDEVNLTTGIFTNTNGIVSTLNKLRVVTFRYPSTSNYDYASGWITTRPINEGEAAEWGNPVAEMMYESLRYLAGKASPTTAYKITATDTPDATLGLPLPNWLDPYQSTASGGGGFASCAKPMQLVISDINPSYDTDQLPGSYFNTFSGDLTGLDVSALADTIWDAESEADTVFIGQSKTVSDGAPTAKSVDSFKDIRGMAPEEPTKLGGFYAGSIALHGRQTDLHTAIGDQKAETLAVALASPLPRIEIPVAGKTVTLVPFAKSVAGSSINASSSNFQPTNQIVDFYVEKIVNTGTGNIDESVNGGRAYGKFRINYEDVEQAADHDMDAIVEYTFTVNASNQVVVDLNSTYAAGGIVQHMGYVISGTTHDGVYLEVRDKDTTSDTDYFLDTPPGQLPGGTWADSAALPLTTSRTFTLGSTTSASYINHDPLWYAAKWGASDKNDDGILDVNEWDVNSDGKPDNYFLVTNAGKLQEQLNKAFAKLLDKSSSASSVAANATRLDTGTLIYQAKFDTKSWSGKLLALSVNASDGSVDTAHPNWEASEKLPAHGSRKIYTYNPQATAAPYGIPFLWNDLVKDADVISPAISQQAYLNQVDGATDLIGQEKGELRLNWLRGDTTNEALNGGPFRDRKTDCSTPPCVPAYNLLGDIINSDPVFVGIQDYDYDVLPNPEGESYVDFRNNSTYKNRRPMLYVGANDGMLHGFDARKNAESVTTGGTEVFAYVPNALFPKLSSLTSPAYSHKYFVDGLSTSSDAYLDGTWRTLLVGTTGAGGRAVFALDVTYPDDFSSSNVLWEFTGDDDPDLGYTLAQPSIVRMNDNSNSNSNSWVTIVGNGYDSVNGHAVLFILNAKTGAVIKKIDTEAAIPVTKTGFPHLL